MRRAPQQRRLQQSLLAATPEAGLVRARFATQPSARAKYAREGLSCASRVSETRWLLLRQLYLAHLEGGELVQARQVAHEMVQFPPLADVAWHDAARAALAAEQWQEARNGFIDAARVAPEARKFDHMFALARVLAHLGCPEAALHELQRAQRTRQRQDPAGCLFAAEVVWRSATQEGVERAMWARAYQTLASQEQRPVLGDHLAARLLALLGKLEEAAHVHREFLRAVEALGIVSRFSLMPEIDCSRRWLSASPGNVLSLP